MKKSILSLAIISLAGQAFGFQVEAGGELQNSDFRDYFGFGGEFYIEGVNQASGPLAEAAFLAQATRVRANFYDFDAGSRLGAGGRYIDKNSGFFVDGTLFLGDLDGVEIGAGLYLSSNSTVHASYSSTDFSDAFSGEFKHLLFQNDGTYVNLEAGIEFRETEGFFSDVDTTTISAAADYYFDKTMSVGAGIDLAFSDFEDVTALTGEATKFLAPNIAVSGGLTYADYELSDSDIGIYLAGDFRF